MDVKSQQISLVLWHETLQRVMVQLLSVMGLNQTADLCHKEFEKQRHDTYFPMNINNSPFLISRERLLSSIDQARQLINDLHIILACTLDYGFSQATCEYDAVLQKRKADQDMKYFIQGQKKSHASENQMEFVDVHVETTNSDRQIPSRLLTKRLHRGIIIKKDRVDNLEGPLAQTVFPFIKSTHYEQTRAQGSDGLVIHKGSESMTKNDDIYSFHPPCYGLLYHPKRRDTLMILEDRISRMEEYLAHSQDYSNLQALQSTTHPTIPPDIYIRLKRLETALLRIEMKYPSVALKEFHPNTQMSLYE